MAEDTPDFKKVAQRRAALRKALTAAGIDSTNALKDIRTGKSPSGLDSLKGPRKRLADLAAQGLVAQENVAKSFSIKRLGGRTKAKELLKSGRSAEFYGGLDDAILRTEIGPVFDDIMQNERESIGLRDINHALLRDMGTSGGAQEVGEQLIGAARQEREGIYKRYRELEKKHPREYQAFLLTTFVRELHDEGHIAQTQSTIGYLGNIERRMLTGKPIFLHGSTGTGKTSLARRAAESMSGKSPEMIYCNPQTRESNIWGKTGIRPAGGGAIETVDIFGPLARAMQEGKPVIFDEFTALPREQMVAIKGIFNAKPGDSVNIVGNGRVTIAHGFQMIFTANLKSEKNPERQELPPEIAREFEQNNLEIFYTPKHEAYDIMLARLMRFDGSVQMSWHDLNVTLPKFCEALEEIQIAYYDHLRPETARLTQTQISGRAQGLKKFVMTQGTVEAILEAWTVEKRLGATTSFARFLDLRLSIGLTFKEYSEADRILAAKILASKGLLRTISPRRLGLPDDVFNFDAATQQRGNDEAIKKLVEYSGKEVRVPIMELADLDPWDIRKKNPAQVIAQEFLPSESPAATAPAAPPQSINPIPVPWPDATEMQFSTAINAANSLHDLERVHNAILASALPTRRQAPLYEAVHNQYDRIFKAHIKNASSAAGLTRVYNAILAGVLPTRKQALLYEVVYDRFVDIFGDEIKNARTPNDLGLIYNAILASVLPTRRQATLYAVVYDRYTILFSDLINNAKNPAELQQVDIAIRNSPLPTRQQAVLGGAITRRSRSF
ncbi:AAA family ATPase [Candidatus Kaiserbacteria bacterium]|nr:AAA family ATPase [Candidatus Kaiserbacteria bacterium]